MKRKLTVGACALALFAVVTWLMSERPPKPTRTLQEDVHLYQAIVSDLRAGGAYYDVVGNELRARGFAVRPVFNWREPLLYRTMAALPWWAIRSTIVALTILLVLYVIVQPYPRFTPLFVAHGLIGVAAIDPLYFTELWAGVCLALSAVALAARRSIEGVAWAIVALAIRELAAPYCVVMTLYAAWRRDWREVRAWMVGALVFALYYGWHAWHAMPRILPSDRVHEESWLYFGGVVFLLRVIQATGLLFFLPAPVFASVIVFLVGAWWADRMPMHVRLAVVTYAVFFMCVGQPFDVYWGYLIAPVLALWGAYAPQGIQALLARSRAPGDHAASGLRVSQGGGRAATDDRLNPTAF
jgi:hypothetical protein